MHLSIAHPIGPKRASVHACQIMDHFGVGFEDGEHVVADRLELPIAAGDIVAFTGPSGSGKSSLLRAAAAQLDGVVDMHALELPNEILVDGLGLPLDASLELLAACGLSEAQLLLRTPAELSEGQRYRYRLAYALARGAKWILADEFTASLDRTLAQAIAYNIGRLAQQHGCGILIATTHDDVIPDLQPTLHVACRLNGEPAVTRNLRRVQPIRFADDLTIGVGSKADWPAFAGWHYRGKKLGFIRQVMILRHRDEPVGICVFTTPCRSLRPRNCFFGIGSRWSGLNLRALNAQLVTLSRVVLHPTYRGIGVGARFVRRCCEAMPFPFIETLTEMGHINPFFERAGFRRIGVCEHPERSRAEHSAIYGTLRHAERKRQLLSQATYEKSRHAAPVYYVFDNRERQSEPLTPEARLPLFAELIE